MAKYKIIPSSRTIVQSPISIGHKAEKGVEAIEFDLTAWVETYGSGTLTVIMRRWGDAIPYPIALEIDENNKATWTLSDTDTAKAGMAYAQLSYVVRDEVVKKSDIYTFRVMDSLTGEGEPPEAYESWLEHLTHLAAEAMAEVLDIEGIVTDKTLTVDGGIADAKAAGDALALKADKSTTYTKTEVDQMIEDVEIETDTTLEIAGAPADAAETGRQIGLLKADLDEQISTITKTEDATIDKTKAYDTTDITSTLTISAGQVNETTGAISGASSYSHTNKISVAPGYKITTSRVFRRIAAYNGDTIQPSSGTGTSASEYVVPEGVDNIIISFASGTYPFNVSMGVPSYTFKYIDEINKVNEMQKYITLTSDNPNATLGENIANAISNWSAIGSSVYADGVWALSASGDGVSIPLGSATEANGHYLIELTFVAGSVNNGVDKINQLTFTLGDDSTSIFCANDGNFNVVLSPSTNVSALTIVGSGDNFAISINSVTVKKVLAYSDAFIIANINQFRTAGTNFGFGFGLRYMAKGANNTSLGNRAQEYLDTGIWNTAIGNNAQRRIRNGVGNSAIGNNAEVNITNGCYNNAFGTSALANISSGCWNNGFGNETLRDTTTGHNNVAFGRRALNSLIDGCANIAIGAQAGFYPNPSIHDNNNIFIGIKACRKATSISTSNDKAIAIGSYARAGNNGIAIGSANANESPTIAEDNQINIGNASHTSVIVAGKTIHFNSDGSVTWS